MKRGEDSYFNMFALLKKIIHYGWLNFHRQSSFSVVTIFIMMVVIFLFTSLFLFQGAVQFLTLNLQEKIDISVYFNQESSEQEILKIKEELAGIPQVEDVEYVSNEDALEKFTLRHQNDSMIMESLAEVGGNPFLASLNIRARDSAQYAGIFNFITNSSFKETIAKVDYIEKKSIIERLFSLTSDINKAGIIFSLVLAFFAVLIAFNQVRLAIHNSGKEIKIMRLVGAPDLLITGPFLVQGVIIGILSVLFCLLIFFPACFFLSPKLEIIMPGFHIFHYFVSNFFFIFLIQMLVGVGIGAFSSFIAVRKYLKI